MDLSLAAQMPLSASSWREMSKMALSLATTPPNLADFANYLELFGDRIGSFPLEYEEFLESWGSRHTALDLGICFRGLHSSADLTEWSYCGGTSSILTVRSCSGMLLEGSVEWERSVAFVHSCHRMHCHTSLHACMYMHTLQRSLASDGQVADRFQLCLFLRSKSNAREPCYHRRIGKRPLSGSSEDQTQVQESFQTIGDVHDEGLAFWDTSSPLTMYSVRPATTALGFDSYELSAPSRRLIGTKLRFDL